MLDTPKTMRHGWEQLGRMCVKNVYSVGITLGKVAGLHTTNLRTPLPHVDKPSHRATVYPQLTRPHFHRQFSNYTPVKRKLYPLSTTPIISNHELRKERIV